MKRSFLWKLALTIVCAPCLLTPFFPSNTLPIDVTAVPGLGYVVRPIDHIAFPEALRSGDVIALDLMTPEARAASHIAIRTYSVLAYRFPDHKR